MKLASHAPGCESPFGNHPLLIIPFFRRWKRTLARDLVYTFIWNSAFALAFSAIGMLFDDRARFVQMFWPNFVFAQCIGYLIHLTFVIGEHAWPGINRRGPVLRAAYYTLVPLVCVFLGMWIASGLLGGNLGHWIMQPRNLMVTTAVSLIISCILLVIYVARERAAGAEVAVAQETARVAAAERTTALAQMKLLEAQVEPHFLYNTLAHVDSMIESDPATARRMLERLIALLRATAASANESATLSRQVDWTRAYLELLQMRMGPRLEWTIDVDAELNDVVVPPAILQPLVENAVKHGLEPRLAGGAITISAHRRGGMLALDVADTGNGFRTTQRGADSTGIGLANLRARLAKLYGDRANMIIADNVPSGARVALSLPLE